MKKTAAILSSLALFICSANIVSAESGDGRNPEVGTQINAGYTENKPQENDWTIAHKYAIERSQER